MKNSKKLFTLLLGSFCLFILSCTNNNVSENVTNEAISKNDSTSTNARNSDEIFKHWLKDTLVNLYSWKSGKEKDIVKKEIALEKDSLLLTTNAYYSVFIDKKEKGNGEISNMIDLLKEYNELPKNDFKLSFLYQMFYYPSSVEQLQYDFVYEIKDIEIIEDKSKTKFDFVRGRLTGKELIKENKNGKQEIIKTEFIWNGDTLVKKTHE